MMEEKAWSKLHLSLRGPQPCEKNCFGMSKDIRIVCSFLFSPFFSQLMMKAKSRFKFTSHWEALNLVIRTQNQCEAALECLDMSEYFAIFFFQHPLPGYVKKDNPNCTSPNWCYLHLPQPGNNRSSETLLPHIFNDPGSKPCHLKAGRKKSTNSSEFPQSQAERLFMKKEWLLAIIMSEDSSEGPMSSYRSAIMKMLIVFLFRPAKSLRISTSLLLALKHLLTKN